MTRLLAAVGQAEATRASLLAPAGRRLRDASIDTMNAAIVAALHGDPSEADTAAAKAWDAWADYANNFHRCLSCTVALAADYPWANCFEHEPDDHQREWIAYLVAGKVWPA